MPEYPDTMVYSARHIWVKPSADTDEAYIGVTDFLTEELGEITTIDLPMVGDEVERDDLCIHFHVRNRIRHSRCPLTGRILEVNQEVLDNPGLLYLDYQANWLFKMEFDDRDELDQMMSGTQYAKYLDSL